MTNINGSFEQGWATLVNGNQVPNGWELMFTSLGDSLPADPSTVATRIPECVHKPNNLLPPKERRGGKDALVLNGEHVYKIFGTGAWGVVLQRVVAVEPFADVVLNINVRCHWTGGDPYTAEFCASLNEPNCTNWWNGTQMPNRRWIEMAVVGKADKDGLVLITAIFKNKWPINVDFFIDNWTLKTSGGVNVAPNTLEQRVTQLETTVTGLKSEIEKLKGYLQG